MRRLKYDHERYMRAAAAVGAAALWLRASTLPPPWVFEQPALRRAPERSRIPLPANAFRCLTRVGAGSALFDLVMARRVSIRTTLLVLAAERLTATRLAGFAPYTDHLYVFASYLSFAQRPGGRGARDRSRPAPIVHLPAVVYFASAVAKLNNGRASWTGNGEVVANALDLYGWTRVSRWADRIDPAVTARAVLVFEAMALPVALSGLRGLRAVSLLGLLFHTATFATLRISFWHLALVHLPTLYAIRGAGPETSRKD
ncbi:hypothetical protein [Nocardia sp. X0981]